MVFGESVTIGGPDDIDPCVTDPRTDVDRVIDGEVVTVRVAIDHWITRGEVHHGVGVQVENKPSAAPESPGYSVKSRTQVRWREIVQPVECGNRRIEDTIDCQVRKRVLYQGGLRPEESSRAGQHHCGGVHTDDVV